MPPRADKGVRSLQAVRECTYAAGTILYIDNVFLDKQYMVYIGWVNFILGQPVTRLSENVASWFSS